MSEVSLLHVPAQLVVFRVGPTRYGLDIDVVQEIIGHQPPTPLPGAPQGVLGVVDVRKRVVPVFDLHWKFGVPLPEKNASARLIVVEVEESPVALLVDAVDEVVSLPREAYQPVKTPGNTGALQYLQGVARRNDSLVLWVDHEAMVPRGIAMAKAA